MCREAVFVATTSFTRRGVEACVDFLESIRSATVWLPLPVELCGGQFVDLGPFEKYLEPLVALYHAEKWRWRCYGSLEELKWREWAAVKLAALAVKARAFGKFDLSEWDALFVGRRRGGVPRPALVFGVLPHGDVVVCGTYPPSPVEAAWEGWSKLGRGERLELASWVVQYLSYVLESEDLDEAYSRLLQAGWESAFRRLFSHL